MVMTVDQLRKQFPVFTYRSYQAKYQNRELTLSAEFNLGSKIKFRPRVVIENIPPLIYESLPAIVLDNLAFQLGLAEIPSYWKAACSPVIRIEAGYLDEFQMEWWKNFIFKGLGEFFYTNQIDFTGGNFLKIEIKNKSRIGTKPWLIKLDPQKALVPVGGGKDSIVTLKSLAGEFELTAFGLNPTPAAKSMIAIQTDTDSILAQRTIDPQLLKLNSQGFLNGHTPFSGYLAFLTTLVALLYRIRFIAVSNESSANEENLIFQGQKINHQYTKTFEFEKLFFDYSRRYLAADIYYFSFLRPLNELQIAKFFGRYPEYFTKFVSCNAGQRKNAWCGRCAKCLFVYSILSAFLPSTQVENIFGRDLLDDKSLLPIARRLLGVASHKPFECVGTKQESAVAWYLSLKNRRGQTRLPALLEYFEKTVLPGIRGVEPQTQKILESWDRRHLLPPEFEKLLKGQLKTQVVVLGFGREGRAFYQFFRNIFPHDKLIIADVNKELKFPNDKNIQVYVGENYLDSVKQADIIVKSPGIPPELPQIRQAVASGAELTSSTKIFFDNCPAPIIGVTGTKGKSTAASLIYQVLKAGGKKVFLAGNIGEPVLPYLKPAKKDNLVVMELSSHQLFDLNKSPHIAVLLNLYPEHLDYYQDFEKYKMAKSRITLFQKPTDFLIYRSSNPGAAGIAGLTRAKTIPFRIKKDWEIGCFVEDGHIVFINNGKKEKTIAVKDVPLVGRFNLHNVMPAVIVGRLLGIPIEIINKAIKNFKPLQLRLELVGKFRGVFFYNDPLATIPQATMAALEALRDNVETLLLGGFDRGTDFSGLAKELLKSSVKNLILFPTSGTRIKTAIEKIAPHQTKMAYYFSDNMKDAVDIAYRKTSPGKICLHSPASPSFVGFKDYRDRGDQFKKFVTAPPPACPPNSAP